MNKIMVFTCALLLGITAWGKADDTPLRVAVFPFESDVQKGGPQVKDFLKRALESTQNPKDIQPQPLSLGEKISDLLSAKLTKNPSIELVERAKIDKAFDELALGKTGIVDDASAAKIGHMVGAQVLVTGKAFPLDEEIFIVAKVIGVETGRVFSSKTSGSLTGKLAPLVEELSTSVSKVFLKNDKDLVGKDVPAKDYESLLKKSLGEGKKPIVSVYVKEQHINRDTLDPAVETEIIYLLQKSGFEVMEERNKQLADWAQSYLDDNSLAPPRSTKVEIAIVGEAFSEFAARRGELVSCKARIELKAIDIKSGKVLSIERRTETAVDIAEQIAAKNALQKAAEEASLTFIPVMMKKWQEK